MNMSERTNQILADEQATLDAEAKEAAAAAAEETPPAEETPDEPAEHVAPEPGTYFPGCPPLPASML